MNSGRGRVGCVAVAAAVAVCLCFDAAGMSAQRAGGFRVLGPGGGGTMLFPAISPHDSQTALVACDMTGQYITHDGGKTWRMFNLRGVTQGFAFDPVDPHVIYALGIGLWRSADDGATWSLLAPSPSNVSGVRDPSDAADETILTNSEMSDSGGGFRAVTALGIDPLDGRQMYMANGSKLWHTKNGGAHWSSDGGVPGRISQLALVHKDGGRGVPDVWVASDMGFFVDRSWNPLQLPLPAGVKHLHHETIDVAGGKVLLLAVADDALYEAVVDAVQKNPAVEWHALALPGTGARVRLTASGHDGKTIYASFSNLTLDGSVWEGLAKSEDLGAHWTLVLKDRGKGVPNLQGAWMESSLPSDWGEEPHGLAVSKKDHQLIYATDLGRTIKSTDGGAHWTVLYSHTAPDGGAVSSGLDVLSSYGVQFDPFHPQRMFVDYTDIGLMRSDNHGESWKPSTDGVPREWNNTVYWMVFDPAVPGRVWAAMSGTHDLPRPRMWRHHTIADLRGGICESLDGGVTWSVRNTGMPESAPTHIVLDPKSPPGARTLYVATMGRGVFKSVDGGRNWVQKNKGMTQPYPLAWRLALATDGTLYAVIARSTENGTIGNERDGALYRSRDGAETWERVTLPAGVNGPNGLAIDPRDPSRMYLAAWALSSGQHGTGGGIYLTTDAGAHWKAIFTRDQHVYDVTWNPANPSELYATGFGSSAWHSVDRGEHWQRIAGYNFKAGHRVTPDPLHPGMVFINTFGGGVWYGSVDGKAGVEDIATKEIAP